MTLSWAFEDEATALSDQVLKRLEATHAVTPALWAFEVASVLTAAERRGRINAVQQAEFLDRLRRLPVAIEHRPAAWLCQQILPLARTTGLSAYDAAYLELAVREGMPLATLDDDLEKAARTVGVPPRRSPAVSIRGFCPASGVCPIAGLELIIASARGASRGRRRRRTP